MTNFFDLSAIDIDNNKVEFSKYKGKVILVVNVASECGLTKSNYQQLQPLYEKYKDEGFEIFAFPCNQFGKQEPGTPSEIKEFCTSKYSVTFPIFEKVEVNGDNTHPVYKFLKEKHQGDITWNFEKFLINRQGQVKRFSPRQEPITFENEIKELLKQ